MATSVRIVIVGDVLQWICPSRGKIDLSDLHFQMDIRIGSGSDLYKPDMMIGILKKIQMPFTFYSLGKQHVGYSRLDMPVLKLSVVGGRPFSSGGDKIFRPKLLSQRYGVRNLEESKKKIINAALGAPDGHSLIFLAHNGPSGLGSKIDDICGKDWVFGGGDHGDSDLAQALLELRSKQLPIPLVVFGHMHKGLAYGGLRKMIVVGADGTIYLNGAIVPRVKNLHGRAGSSKTNNELHPEVRNEDGTVRAFSVVDIEKGRVKKISETWILVTSKRTALEQENILFQRP
ncbi:uncharacterized protein LOC110098993 isoform X4 [Dendrobium catenatum]|nr:uncharacterized protein LOC110098993 isoform X4 [Dendrobium catenatum]XP_028548265.1 uncharacterized protein LOC110098993 isoform X4 [Dendrobium catenatum]